MVANIATSDHFAHRFKYTQTQDLGFSRSRETSSRWVLWSDCHVGKHIWWQGGVILNILRDKERRLSWQWSCQWTSGKKFPGDRPTENNEWESKPLTETKTDWLMPCALVSRASHVYHPSSERRLTALTDKRPSGSTCWRWFTGSVDPPATHILRHYYWLYLTNQCNEWSFKHTYAAC